MATRLVLLGTGGGPTPKVARSAPAQAVVVDGHSYVIDCDDVWLDEAARGLGRDRIIVGRDLLVL